LSCRLPRMMPFDNRGYRQNFLFAHGVHKSPSIRVCAQVSKHIDTFLYQPVDYKAEVIGHRLNNSGMGFIPHAEIPKSSRRSYE
jgi:hypothetical protein